MLTINWTGVGYAVVVTNAGDAAGWCFHNFDTRGRPDGESRCSSDLPARGLFEQLDSEERTFQKQLQSGQPQP